MVLGSGTCGHQIRMRCSRTTAFWAIVAKLMTPVFFGSGHWSKDPECKTIDRIVSSPFQRPAKPSRESPTKSSSSWSEATAAELAINGTATKPLVNPLMSKNLAAWSVSTMFFLPEFVCLQMKVSSSFHQPPTIQRALGQTDLMGQSIDDATMCDLREGIPSRHLSHYTIVCFAFAFPMGCHGRCNISDQLMLKKSSFSTHHGDSFVIQGF